MDTATKTRPCFRTDLVAQPIEEKGQVFVDVTDPDSGTTFRFYEIEYSVACAMDGARDVQGLRAWARDELGVEPTEEELTTVIATLDELGYLAPAASEAARSPQGAPEGPGRPAAPAAVPGGATVPGGQDVELGQPGGSDAGGARRGPPPEEVELGHAGPGASARAAVPATSGAGPGETPETSFDGLMDDDVEPAESSRAGTNPFARANKMPIQAGEGAEAPAQAKAPQEGGGAEGLRERARQTDDEDGPTNIPAPASQFDEDEVSLDLSDHLSIGTDDVKEAVRQSQVMQAPEPPAEAEARESKQAEPAAAEAAAKSAKADAGAGGAAAKEEAPQAAKKAPAAKPSAAAAASEAVAAQATPTEPPETKEAAAGGSPMRVGLLVALLFAALGAGGYYAYAYTDVFSGVLAEDSPASAAADATPPEPEPPTAVLSAEEVVPTVVEAEGEGEVSWLAEPGASVDEGEEILRLAGYDALADALEYQLGEEAKLQDYLDQATAEDDRRKMRKLEKRVEKAQEKVAEAEEKLAGYRMEAPEQGIFEPEIEEGAELEPGDPVGEIRSEPRALGVFELESGGTFTEGQAVTLASEGAGEVASCEVVEARTDAIEVACPPSSPLGPGDTATLAGGE